MLTALNYFESSRVHTVFKFLEILCYSLFLSQLSEQTAFSVAGYILIFVLGGEIFTRYKFTVIRSSKIKKEMQEEM